MTPARQRRSNAALRRNAWRLRRIRQERDAILKHAGEAIHRGDTTCAAASRTLGVSERTLRRWRDRARQEAAS